MVFVIRVNRKETFENSIVFSMSAYFFNRGGYFLADIFSELFPDLIAS